MSNSVSQLPESEVTNEIAANQTNGKKEWVKFEEDIPPEATASVQSPSTSSTSEATGAAVLNTETVQINLDRSTEDAQPVFKKNVEFVNVRQGFVNGDIIVTLLPVNTKWPWITAARFRPELVPEELMAQGLTLTVEEYVQALELLVHDVRFTLYNVCYKRVLLGWIAVAFSVLLALLFSGLTGLTLFSLGVGWLVLNAAAIFLCMWLKLRLARGLEQCLAAVNKLLCKHKLVLALDDRGKISCHKVNLCFLYLDPAPCVAHLRGLLEREDAAPPGWETRLDVSADDIVIQGATATRLSRKQGVAEQAFLRYLQRWGKDFLRRRLDWTLDDTGGAPAAPRHLRHALCPCQYVQELLEQRGGGGGGGCPALAAWLRRCGLARH